MSAQLQHVINCLPGCKSAKDLHTLIIKNQSLIPNNEVPLFNLYVSQRIESLGLTIKEVVSL